MILLMDVGNSAIRWRSLTGQSGGDIPYRDADLSSVLKAAFVPQVVPQGIYVASVAGDALNQALADWCQRQWQQCPHFVASEAQAFGVTSGYEQPAQLGVDRWLVLVGARSLYEGPLVVVDCGTAITIDTLDGEGRHQGGLILPGEVLMRRALNRDTDAIGVDERAQGEGLNPYGQTTQAAVNQGTRYGVVGAIDRVLADLQQQWGSELRGLITGGGAEALMPVLETELEYRPELVLEGLARYAVRDLES